jgi:hypothetical protein
MKDGIVMNILMVTFGLLLPMVLATQRPIQGFLNMGSTTLSGHNSIVFEFHDHDRTHRLKLLMMPVSLGYGADQSRDDGSCRRGQDSNLGLGVRAMFRA